MALWTIKTGPGYVLVYLCPISSVPLSRSAKHEVALFNFIFKHACLTACPVQILCACFCTVYAYLHRQGIGYPSVK